MTGNAVMWSADMADGSTTVVTLVRNEAGGFAAEVCNLSNVGRDTQMYTIGPGPFSDNDVWSAVDEDRIHEMIVGRAEDLLTGMIGAGMIGSMRRI